MNSEPNDIAMIGLGTMGRNLVLNMADKGFAVAAFNRTASVTDEFVSSLQPGQRVRALLLPGGTARRGSSRRAGSC